MWAKKNDHTSVETAGISTYIAEQLNAPELVANVIDGVKYENGQEVTTTTKKNRRKVAA